MRIIVAGVLSVAVVLLPDVAAAAAAAAATSPAPATEEDRTLYALGLVIGRSLESFSLTPKELELVKTGLGAAVGHATPAVDVAVYGPKIQELQKSRQQVFIQKEHAAGTAYLESAAKENGATRTPSGIVIQTLKEGTGPNPKTSDQVRVHYEGKLTDGTVFDSSIKRGEPATFPLTGVIRCWTEAVPMMKVGGRSRIVCPADLAYGDRGSGPMIRPGATLVFEIELLEIVAAK